MNAQRFIIFMVVFLAVTLGTPFFFATFLPKAMAILGSIGVSVLTGAILFFVLGFAGKDASPTQ